MLRTKKIIRQENLITIENRSESMRREKIQMRKKNAHTNTKSIMKIKFMKDDEKLVDIQGPSIHIALSALLIMSIHSRATFAVEFS